jgi:type I restriction enzyme S subunit
MNSQLSLNKAAFYSEDRIHASKIQMSSFVTTDSMLQNKDGIAISTILPKGNLIAFSKGDVLVGNIRPYLKKIWFADRAGGCSPDVLVFKAKPGTDPKFLYYSLFRDDFFNHMMKGSKGTKMPRGDKNQILRFHIPEFEFDDQRRIAKVLSALDAKIELNKTINVELDNLAKTLYDYWFVQFDFPDENGKPYKESGGKMVWNKELKREIPEGWTNGELKDIANITMGQSPPGESYNERGDGIIFFQGCTDFGRRFPTVRQFTTQPTRHAIEGDILLSVRAPVGTMNIANVDCCIGRGLAALNSKNNCIAYVYGVMMNLKQIFDRRNVDGTTFGAITKNDLFSLKVVKPNRNILKRYQQITSPSFQKQNKIEQENQKLSELRDWLLPMLMNGQVKVKEAEQILNIAAERSANYTKPATALESSKSIQN